MNDDKLLNLAGGKILYDDLRDRIKETDGELTDLWDAVDGKVTDVQVNGTSVVQDGVANVPIAGASAPGVVSPDAKTSAMTQAVGVDAGGKLWTAAGSGGSYPTKVIDYTFDGNWYKIDVASINYSTGVITLAANDAPFTDNYNTSLMVWAVPLIDGVIGTYAWGFMPPELYAVNGSQIKRGVLVDTNQIKIYTNATTSIDTITETSNVDFSRFQIWATEKRSNVPQVSVTDLAPNHRYRFLCAAPYGGECGVDIRIENNKASGSALQNGYSTKAVGVSTANNEQFYSVTYNRYEAISMRSTRMYSTDEKMFMPFPKFVSADIFRASNGSLLIDGFTMLPNFGNKTISNITASETMLMVSAKVNVYLNGSIHSIITQLSGSSGASYAPLDGCRFALWDMGEEY